MNLAALRTALRTQLTVGQGRFTAAAVVALGVGLITILSIPPYRWTDLGLLTLGAGATIAALPLACRKRSPSADAYLLQTLGLFCLVYGLSCVYGGTIGHRDPVFPLKEGPRDIAETAYGTWKVATGTEQLAEALESARKERVPALVFWDAQWCDRCSQLRSLGLLDPRINPYLAGYRLVRMDLSESTADTKALLDQFRLFGPPAITIIDASGISAPKGRLVGRFGGKEILAALQATQPTVTSNSR